MKMKRRLWLKMRQKTIRYVWKFDSSNPVAHAAWNAFMHGKETMHGAVSGETKGWNPIAQQVDKNTWSVFHESAQNSFMYRLQSGMKSLLLYNQDSDCKRTLAFGRKMQGAGGSSTGKGVGLLNDESCGTPGSNALYISWRDLRVFDEFSRISGTQLLNNFEKINIENGNSIYGLDITYEECKTSCLSFTHPAKESCGSISYNHYTKQCVAYSLSAKPHRGIIEFFNNDQLPLVMQGWSSVTSANGGIFELSEVYRLPDAQFALKLKSTTASEYIVAFDTA